MMCLQPRCNIPASTGPHITDINRSIAAPVTISTPTAGRPRMSSQAGQVVKVVRCNCGVELRSANEQELIQTVQDHARASHDLNLDDEQVRSMMEIDQ